MFIVKKISIFPVKTMAVATSTQDLNLVELKGLLICIDIIQFRTLLFHITDAQDTTSSLLGDIYLASSSYKSPHYYQIYYLGTTYYSSTNTFGESLSIRNELLRVR